MFRVKIWKYDNVILPDTVRKLNAHKTLTEEVQDISWTHYQKQPPELFCKKRCFRNFAKFTGKHLCQSLFFNKAAGLARNFIKKKTLA